MWNTTYGPEPEADTRKVQIMGARRPCQQPDTRELFYSETPSEQRRAAAMCSGCPFQAECAERGRTEEWGVWGGLTQWDRPSAAALAKEAEKDRKAARLAERNKRIRHYGRTGIYTAADIARDFNLSEQTVKGILAQEGRVRATGPKILDPAERAQRDGLIRSMRSHGKPVSQIAHEFSLTDGTVYAILRSA